MAMRMGPWNPNQRRCVRIFCLVNGSCGDGPLVKPDWFLWINFGKISICLSAISLA